MEKRQARDFPFSCATCVHPFQTIVETEEEEEQRALREWKDDGRKGRVLVRRSECLWSGASEHRMSPKGPCCYRVLVCGVYCLREPRVYRALTASNPSLS